jgi:hypothetical protein
MYAAFFVLVLTIPGQLGTWIWICSQGELDKLPENDDTIALSTDIQPGSSLLKRAALVS